MSNDIYIPPEAVEAGIKAFWESSTGGFAHPLAMTAATRAALKAWPGMLIDHRDWPECHLMVLPLTQENTDAEA